jgi:hypothetical protein
VQARRRIASSSGRVAGGERRRAAQRARRAAACAAPRSELPRLARQDLQGAPQPRWSKRNEPEPHTGPLPAPRRHVPRQRSVQRRTGGMQSSPARAAGHRFPALCAARAQAFTIVHHPAPFRWPLHSRPRAPRRPSSECAASPLAVPRPGQLLSPPKARPSANLLPIARYRSAPPRPGPSFRMIIVRRGYTLSGREFWVLGLWGSVCYN